MRAFIGVEARDYLGPGGLNRIPADSSYETGEVSAYRQSARFMPFVCVLIFPAFTVCDEYLHGILGGD
jgi:hypothetical protein